MEENPFEERHIAEQWIATVENEKGTIRDKEINPQLKEWLTAYSPKKVLDIGCGQGICSENVDLSSTAYIGVDPSLFLIERAKQIYNKPNCTFVVGNAYSLPIEDNSVDAAFSITVWFHLENLSKASEELSRVLSDGGRFMIVTADPDSYDLWDTHYSNTSKEGKKVVGSAKVLLNPDDTVHKYARMDRNTFYRHSIDEIMAPLNNNGLKVDEIVKMGILPIHNGRNLFITIVGHKQ
jgi:ubiquinone/menaquinone biosynthesis C-methylase UbiE